MGARIDGVRPAPWRGYVGRPSTSPAYLFRPRPTYWGPPGLLAAIGSRTLVIRVLRCSTRISISLEQNLAERIKQHAERAGMDVSAYLVQAATCQMAESDAIEEHFAEVDALTARAEQTAEGLPVERDSEPAAELTEQERREVQEALGLVQGRDRQSRRPGPAA